MVRYASAEMKQGKKMIGSLLVGGTTLDLKQ